MNPADTKSPKTDIDEEKAKILAKYFLSVFTTETKGNVPNLELNQSINPISSLEISEENILKMLNTLKIDKSPGPDELHPRVLEEISSSITKPLYQLFWFPETSSSSEKQATGPGLLKDSPYSIS